MKQTHINFQAIQEIAVTGVRRTAVFMGLGLNAANDPDFKQYELTNLTQIQIIPPDADEKTLSHFKTEFGHWIVANGLRELIETFSVFLDEVHSACLQIGVSCNQIPADEFESRDRKFRHGGLHEKLTYLQDHFGIGTKHQDSLISINQARHCLTHRRGVVGKEDCSDGKELIVKWLGFDIYAEIPTGETISLQPVPEGGVFLPDGGQIMLKGSERIMAFPLHNLVTFSPRDLAEICNLVLSATTEIIVSAQTYATNNGIQLAIEGESTVEVAKNTK